jgi:CBS domain-containing membrane protein
MVSSDELCNITEKDLRDAIKDLKGYVDVTEEDLKTIFFLALDYAKKRLERAVPVSQAMTRQAIAVHEDMDIAEALRILVRNRISGLPVINDEGRVVGIITELDIITSEFTKDRGLFEDLERSFLKRQAKKKVKVKEVMTSPPVTITPEEDIRVAARLLSEKGIKRLPVVDEKGRLVGIISRADIVRAIGEGWDLKNMSEK